MRKLTLAILAAAILSVSMGVIAIVYQPSHDFRLCLFSDPACSAAVWGYAVAVLAALAFAAALEGGRFAKRAADAAMLTLQHERAKVLTIEECSSDCAMGRHGRFFLEDVHLGLFEQPSRQAEFATANFCFQNIGKSALTNVAVKIHCKRTDGGENKLDVPVGALGAGERWHFELAVLSEVHERVTFTWGTAVARLPRIDAKVNDENPVDLCPRRDQLRFITRERWAIVNPEQQLTPQRPEQPQI